MAEQGRPTTINQLASSPDTYGTTMLAIAIKALGPDFMPSEATEELWDPQTILMELSGFLRTPVNPTAFNRMMAAIAVVTTDYVFKSLPDFIQIVSGLTGGTPPGVVSLPDAFDVTWGITESVLLWPPDAKDTEPFVDEIVDYIGAVLKREGIINPPDVLRLGLRDDTSKLLDKIHAEFTDDPAMFNAIFDMEKNKTHEIEDDLRFNLQQLASQLAIVDNAAFGESVSSLLHALDAQEVSNDQLRPIL